MSADAWFKFYPSDWLAGTRGLSAAETGVYVTLIAMIYEKGSPIDMDRKRLARLCGASASAFEQALAALIEHEKIIEAPGGLWNVRAENELKKRSQKRELARQSAHQRWGNDKENQRQYDANAFQSGCEYDANAMLPESQNTLSRDKGAEAPQERVFKDIKERLWAEGPAILVAMGVDAKQARSLIGRWLKITKNDPRGVMEAIERAELQSIIDPVPWITMAVRPRAAGRVERTKSAADRKVVTLNDIPEEKLRDEVRIFVERQGMCQWIYRHLTPPPDDPATLVPQHILTEFNLCGSLNPPAASHAKVSDCAK